MPAKKNSPKTYSQLAHELEEVMAALQAEDIDVDVALSLYEKGTALAKELAAYLQERENSLIELSEHQD